MYRLRFLMAGIMVSTIACQSSPDTKILKYEGFVIDRIDHDTSIPHSSCPQCPRHFRTTYDVISKNKQERTNYALDGLNALNLSGSGEYSESQAENFLGRINKNQFINYDFDKEVQFHTENIERIIVVDVRQESHGFLNFRPISEPNAPFEFMPLRFSAFRQGDSGAPILNQINFGYSNKEAAQREINFINTLNLLSGQTLSLRKKDVGNPDDITEQVLVNSSIDPVALSEKSLLERVETKLGDVTIQYIRFYVPDANVPNQNTIDQLKILASETGPNDWVHFHCLGGSGRTTTFWILYDIFKNASTYAANNISFDDVLNRSDYFNGSEFSEAIKANKPVIQLLHKEWQKQVEDT